MTWKRMAPNQAECSVWNKLITFGSLCTPTARLLSFLPAMEMQLSRAAPPPTKSRGIKDQQFDLITYLEGFLMTGYYCENCEKAYSNAIGVRILVVAFTDLTRNVQQALRNHVVTVAGHSEMTTASEFIRTRIRTAGLCAKSCSCAKNVMNLST